MRVCGGFSHRQELARPVERPKTHTEARERVRAPLLPVDNAQRVTDVETGVADGRDGLGKSTAGGDDLLHHAHELTTLERAFDPIRRAVFLGLTTDDNKEQTE